MYNLAARPAQFLARAARMTGVALAAAALTAGCATTSGLRQAEQAERHQDWDRAVVEYTAAVRAHPEDQDARLALERAKLRATQEHATRGRRLASLGKLEEALVELQIASQLSPASTELDDAVREVRNQLRSRIEVTRDGKTQLQTLIERTRDLPPQVGEAHRRLCLEALARYGQ